MYNLCYLCYPALSLPLCVVMTVCLGPQCCTDREYAQTCPRATSQHTCMNTEIHTHTHTYVYSFTTEIRCSLAQPHFVTMDFTPITVMYFLSQFHLFIWSYFFPTSPLRLVSPVHWMSVADFLPKINVIFLLFCFLKKALSNPEEMQKVLQSLK